MKLKLDITNKSQKVLLKGDFHLQGNVVFRNSDLSKILNSDTWGWIGNSLAKELLKKEKLKKLDIVNDMLILNGFNNDSDETISEKFSIKASCGSILISNKEKGMSYLLPMDSSIKIQEAVIIEDKLNLAGISTVTP